MPIKKDVKKRLITGFIVGPIAGVMFFSYYSLLVLAAIVIYNTSFEVYTMSVQKNNKFNKIISVILAMAIFFYGINYFLFNKDVVPVNPNIMFFFSFFLICLLVLIKIKNINDAKEYITSTSFNIFYVVFFLSFYLNIHYNYGALMALLAITSVWVYDIGAYFIGIKFGKHKLSPIYSPKKSWEGFIGGFIFTFIYILIFEYIKSLFGFSQILSVPLSLSLAIVVALFDTVGDLTESIFKRFYKTKDSSDILPGHGGLLDRIDGLTFVTPMWFFLLQFTRF